MALITSISSRIKNGIAYLKYKYSAKDISEDPMYTISNIESRPRKNVVMLALDTPHNGEKAILGEVLKTDLNHGETRISSYDDNDILKTSITQLNNGNIEILTPHGKNIINLNGDWDLSSGVKITNDGNVITKNNINLNDHTHQAGTQLIGNNGAPVLGVTGGPIPTVANVQSDEPLQPPSTEKIHWSKW